MKQRRLELKLQVLAASISIAATTFIAPYVSANAENSDLANSEENQLAQAADSCRRVFPPEGAYVHSQPTVYGSVIGSIAGGRYVMIESGGINDWVPISIPLKGYIFTGYLTSCAPAPPPPPNCRQVVATNGVYVYQQPLAKSAIVGVIASGRYVLIENQSSNGWVPISIPLKGYVLANYLSECS
ncbi:SH3 domain-containing protein [Gloeocapsopsis dulcis]|uniref:SH3b domain-containing protein n=1 Tax=Gloeocapsopsis dulcis AAB1 = 1H9 TaxID=1433147 RepID=A0A6N8G283_9CHRO|nr:SH3 domain-containing protein [Gloeocapsopsis dulcis]MUL39518.1 hypothetical protein [Gloeocapsopsis dulcis AAB1 = 1H9]WNN89440.1 SH3 domain-containing protein [Gloeocapsopsis dulcis]